MGFLNNFIGSGKKRPSSKEECKAELADLLSGKYLKHGFVTEQEAKPRIKYLKEIMKTY